jgi:predicted  nucleic acid-binding Zn-ribbon protein
MSVTANALRELHRIHKQLTDLRGQIERGPKQVAGSEATVRRMQMDAEQLKEAYQKARVTSDDKQVQLKGREDKIADLQNKLNLAASNKEYQALKDQIAADQQANLVLQDEILEAMEKIDELEGKVAKSQADYAKAAEEAGKVKQRVDGDQAGLESELTRVQAELKVAEANLPADLKANYDRVAKVRGEEALAEVDGEVCGGCYQMLTPNMMNELYLSRPVFCKSCGALLYLPEGRGAGE